LKGLGTHEWGFYSNQTSSHFSEYEWSSE